VRVDHVRHHGDGAARDAVFFIAQSAILADFRTNASVARRRAWSTPSCKGLTR
jgi:hypothetical protein